jgi:topoisomerase-4 subunit B
VGVVEHKVKSDRENGTLVGISILITIFKKFSFVQEYLDNQEFWNYCYLNAGLVMNLLINYYVKVRIDKDLWRKNK